MPGVYHRRRKICKGPCGLAFDATADHFQRCRKYKDGLDTWCKACSKVRRRERRERAGRTVAPVPRYEVAADGSVRCIACRGRIYDSGIDGEWYCINCGAYVNPPPIPLRYVAARLRKGTESL